jgi:hypothetical protein
MATYYVRKTGNNGNPGTDAQPRLTIASGLTLLSAGDTLIVGDGTYNEGSLNVPAGSAGAGYTVVRSETPRGALIAPSAYHYGIFRQYNNWVEIRDFDMNSAGGGGGGVQVEWGVHHVRVIGNRHANGTLHGCAALGGEFIHIEGNEVFGGRYSDFWSGISIYQARNVTGDTTTTGFRNIIRGNIVYDCTQTGGTPTDGNGIILDDFQQTQAGTPNFATWAGISYPYPTLVENNVCYNNGGRGIQCVWADNVTIRNNTVALNVTWSGLVGTWWDNLSVQYGQNCTVANNIAICDRTQSTARAYGSYDNAGTVWFNNCSYDITSGGNSTRAESGGTAISTGNNPLLGTNPLVVNISRNPALADWRLQSGSPAIDAGTNAYGLPSLDLLGNTRVVGAAVDLGAYEFGSGGVAAVRAALIGGRAVLAGGRLLLGG